ncbi:MAG: glycosyltransferase [Bacteroidales bacterium]|nr:glycosyltransferase [Bacteroidales bacterium]
MARILLAVTNDIVTDQRVHKITRSLIARGHSIKILGRKRKNSPDIKKTSFDTLRFKLLINSGPLFYAAFNFRLFLYLLFTRFTVIVSNDLDTLPACFLAAKIRRKTVVYDSHEYFTEVPELVGRKFVKWIWTKIESLILPRIKYAYTVCDSLAEIYHQKYGINMKVIRNVPLLNVESGDAGINLRKNNERIILYQGMLNMGRGLENVIRAIPFLSNVRLVLIGDGDIADSLKVLVISQNLESRIDFYGRIPADRLKNLTAQADLGISLEENMGLNYYYALPNKLFDYIQANIPVLVSDFPEMSKIVRTYNIGLTAIEQDPKKLAEIISDMLSDKIRIVQWKNNLQNAAKELCWENEEKKLNEFYQEVIAASIF